jgi:hypothetical protein
VIAFSAILASSLVAVATIATARGTAEQIRRSGSFELPCGADTAFPFFSPEGEREWVKGWNPTAVFPGTIEFTRDTVFLEGPPGDEAVWTIVDADWKTHRAEYVRVAHRSHTGRVVVRIEAVGADGCKVVVDYTITAFGEDSAALVETFSEEAYAAKMRVWQEQISKCLKTRT